MTETTLDPSRRTTFDPSGMQEEPPTPPRALAREVDLTKLSTPTEEQYRRYACNVQAGGPVPTTTPGDVRQGDLADCTLHAAMASLARSPAGVACLRGIVDVARDASGKVVGYDVHVFRAVNGTFAPVTVRVDPCDITNEGGAQWPHAVETGLTRVNGAAPASATEAAEVLFGKSGTATTCDGPSFPGTLASDFHAGNMQVLCSRDETRHGVQPRHAYAVLGVSDDGQSFNLYNPMTGATMWLSSREIANNFKSYVTLHP